MTNMTHDARPADAEGLVLESWSQGFMQGALIILIAITVSNMRNKVLLHKLILVEVRLVANPLTCYVLIISSAGLWYLPGLQSLLHASGIRMVYRHRRRLPKHKLEHAQCHRMDEKQAFPV